MEYADALRHKEPCFMHLENGTKCPGTLSLYFYSWDPEPEKTVLEYTCEVRGEDAKEHRGHHFKTWPRGR